MGFAADAITDVITPPPRADRAAAPDDGPNFAEHLDAQADAERTPPEKSATEKAAPDCTRGDEQEAVVAAAPPQQPATPPPSPLTAELFAQLEGGAIADAPAQQQAKPAQTPDAAAPTPMVKNTDCVAAPQTAPQQQQQHPGLLGWLGLNQQQAQPQQEQTTQQQTSQATAAIAPTTLLNQIKEKNAPKTTQATAQTTDATTETPAAQPQVQTQVTDAVAATAQAPAAAPAAQTETTPTPAQGVTLEAEPFRGAKLRGAKADTPVSEAPAAANAQAKSSPLQQALAALRDGASTANTAETAEIKIAAPAQTSATAAAVTQAPAQASQITAEHAAQRIAPASTQVAREIVRRFNGGNTSFELRLDPPELGRIDVRLEVSRDHKVTAVIAADSPQALSDLVRHARELEASLQSAGLDLAENGLSFDLNQSRQGFAESGDSSGAHARQGAAPAEEPTPTLVARPLGLESWRGVRVDVTA